MTNRYQGKCNDCKCTVESGSGILEAVPQYRRKNKYIVWCIDSYDKSHNSSYEDRCCGDRAYEDNCYNATNY